LSQERLASTDRSKAIGKENSASEGSDDFQKKFGGVCEERGQRYKECRNERGFLGMLVSYEEGTYRVGDLKQRGRIGQVKNQGDLRLECIPGNRGYVAFVGMGTDR
jgi:hypothetical protein